MSTTAPPTSVADPGVSPKASQTHSGANGASIAPIRAVSTAGRSLEPIENSERPMAEFTMPKAARKNHSRPDGDNGVDIGKATAALSKAEKHAAAIIGIPCHLRAMTIMTAMHKVIK